MANFHILFGFDDTDIVRTIVNAVKRQRNEVEFATATTKDAIRDYLYRNKTVTTLILREVMGTESFSAEELAQLNDTMNYNIIVVVDASHRGQPFMQTLYAAGITSAILLGEKSGAAPATIADLVLNQRSRKKARDYYGMSNVNVKIDILTSDMFVEKFAMLTNESIGFNIIDRYVQVVRRLTVKQAVDFTRKLPPNIIRELMEYEEYYKVLDYFKRNGYKVNTGKRPKNLKKGLSDEVFLEALSSKRKIATIKSAAASRSGSPVTAKRKVPEQREQRPAEIARQRKEEPVTAQPETPPLNVSEPENKEPLPVDLSMGDLLGVDQDVISPTIPPEGGLVPDMEVESESNPYPTGNSAENTPKPVQNGNRIPVEQVQRKKGKSPVQVVSTSSAFNKGKKAVPKSREKKHINWRVILIILAFGILCLVLWYFTLSLMKIM